MTTINDDAAVRRTAATWHGGQSSPLYAYASTGTVLPGLDREIWRCLDIVEHNDLDPAIDFDLDLVDEHERLLTLLHHIEPEVAQVKAREIGREHGESAAAWWQQHTLGGRATGDTTATARQIRQGIEDGDPAILDGLPAGFEDYLEVDLEGDCDWTEPSPDDRAAYERWAAGRSDIWDAYQVEFHDTVHEAVARACRDALDEPAAPVDLPVVVDTEPGPQLPSTEIGHRHLAQARYSGAWAALVEASSLAMGPEDARAIAFRGENPFGEPSPSGSRIPPPSTGAVVQPVDLSDASLEQLGAMRAEAISAWESGRDAIWPVAVRVTAMRRLGLGEPAEFLERICQDRLHALADAVRAEPIPEVERPYVRPVPPASGPTTGDDIPAGWVAEPIGTWGLRDCEVVYNPRRFDITVISSPGGLSPAAIQDEKWQWLATDGGRGLWARDRIEAARDALARSDQRAAGVEATQLGQRVEGPAPGLEL